MADRYRALLIGNSTYPADEHNLPTLKGPVKDIAALNRALIDPGTGLFADVEVALLPEATSTRAIRALGKFFGTATRNDVLLVYFSGHGKLDQSGRLHLCMQDTESTDLLSTAVSSARINEFADACRARNVVIVLDCCYAGAFRGADLGEAVAGPGRYVLTSCRGTQLANDATVDNGTSYFTQHLVDGLLGAAADPDGDGYVTFSDLYAYVDRRLREAGKQIPQRRVYGDGDVRLARRPQSAPAEVAAAMTPPGQAAASSGQPQKQPTDGPLPGPAVAGRGAAMTAAAPASVGPRPAWAQRNVLLAAAAAAVAIAGGLIIALVLLPGGSGGSFQAGATSVSTSDPWRLKIVDNITGNDIGCTVTLADAQTGKVNSPYRGLFGANMFQEPAGSFRWRVSNPACEVAPLRGPGSQTVPFSWDQSGDTDAFAAPSMVDVQVTQGSDCMFTLRDLATGRYLDSHTAMQANDRVTLNPSGSKTVYLGTANGCTFRVSGP
jgi:hypothetical protein